MARIDYFYKAFVLENYPEFLKKFQIASYNEYAIDNFNYYGVVDKHIVKLVKNGVLNDVYTTVDLLQEINGNTRLLLELSRIHEASKKKLTRLFHKVGQIVVSDDSTFITLTFNDRTLNRTSQETRRRYVSRFLKSLNCEYVGNIDFGEENEREHYHAVISCRIPQDKAKIWRRYGNINFEKVRHTTDNVKLSKYIVKLSNHAIKDSTKRVCLLYSR
jgi:hypothetical protein